MLLLNPGNGKNNMPWNEQGNKASVIFACRKTCPAKLRRPSYKGNYKNKGSGSSLDMYICIHVCDKGIYSRGI